MDLAKICISKMAYFVDGDNININNDNAYVSYRFAVMRITLEISNSL